MQTSHKAERHWEARREKTPWEQETQMHNIWDVAMHIGKDADAPTVTLLIRVAILGVRGLKA